MDPNELCWSKGNYTDECAHISTNVVVTKEKKND